VKRSLDAKLKELLGSLEGAEDGPTREWVLQQVQAFYQAALKKDHYALAFKALDKMGASVGAWGKGPGGDKRRMKRVSDMARVVSGSSEGVNDAHRLLEEKAQFEPDDGGEAAGTSEAE